MRRAVGPFFKGVLSPIAVATSVLLNLIGVANLTGGAGGDPWMWFFFGALVLLVAAFFAYAKLHQERERARSAQRQSERSDELLYRDCTILGGGIDVFVSDRERQVPSLSPAKAVALAEGDLPKGEELDYRIAVIHHEHETQSQYKEQFAAKVFGAVVELRRRGYVAEADMEWMNYPTNLEGIKRVGDRLWELGRRVKPKHWG
jgi:hypothetical protein